MKLLKFLIALALVPLLVGVGWTLVDLAYTVVPRGQWSEMWVLALGAGFLAWFVIFALLPRPMWLYVLGHEFTHALAAMLAGGKVSAFKVTSKGGHIMTDKVNWWIALSPYFVPLYALIWVALWISVDFYYPLRQWVPLLFFGLGLLWCFHLTFTFSMFHKRQTDLTSQGILFSLVIILLFNLLLFLLFFGLLSHDFKKSSQMLIQRADQCYTCMWNEIGRGSDWALRQWQESHK